MYMRQFHGRQFYLMKTRTVYFYDLKSISVPSLARDPHAANMDDNQSVGALSTSQSEAGSHDVTVVQRRNTTNTPQ